MLDVYVFIILNMKKIYLASILFSFTFIHIVAQDTLRITADTSAAKASKDSVLETKPTDYEISMKNTDSKPEKNSATKQFMIFPSVVTTSVNMVAPLGQSGSYSISDASGKVYHNGWLGPGLVTPIFVGKLKSGMYYVRFDGDGHSETRTFMKM